MARTRSGGSHAASHRAPRTGPPARGPHGGGTQATAGEVTGAQGAESRATWENGSRFAGGESPLGGDRGAGFLGGESPLAGRLGAGGPGSGNLGGGVLGGESALTGDHGSGAQGSEIPGGGAKDKAARSGGRPVSRLRARATTPRAIAAGGAVAVLLLGLVLGWASPEPSAEPTVQAFLLAWEKGQYQAAAGMTTGDQATVARELSGAYHQLDAADLMLGIAAISQRGGAANASFNASIDLGRGGLPWTYRGQFALRRTGAGWKVIWSPAVIVPGLHSGERLAVLTTMPRRAQLADAAGNPLAQPSLAYVAGVRPGALKHPGQTASELARATGLPASQMLGQILAAPSAPFLTLVHLRPKAYHRLRRRLHRIPGLIIRPTRTRLFDSIAPAISGSVGTETASVLRENQVPYRPGTTVGLSGLQQEFQRTLAGAPTTEVVVQDAAGRAAAVLKRWPGHRGTPVRTTIDSATQRAADSALSSLPDSAAIVAIRPGSGQILAVAQHAMHGMPAVRPLAGHYQPAQTFTIISTAALLATGFSTSTPTPCNAANTVGGVRFSNDPPEPHLGTQPLFSTDFAHACATAFTSTSLNLDARELTTAAARFGIGTRWDLPLPSFTGAVRSPTDYAQLAADAIGTGSVRVSPLDMALAAGAVQSGTWHSPSLISKPGNPGLTRRLQFRSVVLSQLRTLMRSAVRSGAAKAADVAGPGVYGQVGSVPLGLGQGLRASWFVGFRAGVAFAVLVFAKSADAWAATVAAQFIRALKAGS